MTNEERINALKTLIEKEIVQCTGDQLFLIQKVPSQEQPVAIPVAVFLRKTGEEDDKTKVWFATPTGVFLFECNEFYEFCQEKCKESFLKNLDVMLKQQTAKSLTMGLI